MGPYKQFPKPKEICLSLGPSRFGINQSHDPSEGLYSLITKLKKGKPLVLRLMSSYSGKKMMLYDIVLLVILFSILIFLNIGKESVINIIKAVFSKGIEKTIITLLFGKIIYNLRYCIPQFDHLLNHLKKKRGKEE